MTLVSIPFKRESTCEPAHLITVFEQTPKWVSIPFKRESTCELHEFTHEPHSISF